MVKKTLIIISVVCLVVGMALAYAGCGEKESRQARHHHGGPATRERSHQR